MRFQYRSLMARVQSTRVSPHGLQQQKTPRLFAQRANSKETNFKDSVSILIRLPTSNVGRHAVSVTVSRKNPPLC